MLEWRLLVAWRVDGWHIDLVFSGSVQSAASKHGQTVNGLSPVPSPESPRPHAAYRARTRRSPRRQRRGSEAIPDPSVRPVWVESWASAGKRAFVVALFCHQIVGWDIWVAEKRGPVCRTVPRIGTRERAAAGSATSTPTSCADPQGGSPSPVCRDAALLRGRRPPSRRECAAPPAK